MRCFSSSLCEELRLNAITANAFRKLEIREIRPIPTKAPVISRYSTDKSNLLIFVRLKSENRIRYDADIVNSNRAQKF